MINQVNLSNRLPLIYDWIKNHKPSSETSLILTQIFIRSITIQGSLSFIKKTQEVIKKASVLATGMTILKRILVMNSQRPISIVEASFTGFVPPYQLSFSFEKNHLFTVGLNNQQEREVIKSPSAATFIHECLHFWHYHQDPQYAQRRRTTSPILEMDDQEEEITILGYLHLENEMLFDFCNEAVAYIELGLPYRFNHKGIEISKNYLPSLSTFIQFRAIGSVRKEMIQRSHLYHNHYFKCNHPLEFAISSLRESNEFVQNQWLEIIQYLLQSGIHSKQAFIYALSTQCTQAIKIFMENGYYISDQLLLDLLKTQSAECICFLIRNQIVCVEKVLQLALEKQFLSLIFDLVHQDFTSSEKILKLAIELGNLNLVQFFHCAGTKISEEMLLHAENEKNEEMHLLLKELFVTQTIH